MEQIPKVGQLAADSDRTRDAIHIAVAPVLAAEPLMPGQHIGLVEPDNLELVGSSDRTIGIVDPFLASQINPGDRFWIFLYPGTITGLRHIWSHPEFTKTSAAARDKLK